MSSLFFLISWLSNAFFVFVTLALIVEGCVRLCRFKNYRLRAFVRLIPGVALAFMPLLQYLGIGKFLNPLSCGGWLQKGTFYLFPEWKSYFSFSKEMLLTNYSFAEPLIEALLGVFIAVTAVIFLGKVFHICWTSVQLQQLIRKATDENLPALRNSWIVSQLEKHQVRVWVSDQIQIPMAIGSRTVLVSKTAVGLLKTDEFEAVIGHELAHLLAKDPWTRLFHQLLRAFFWWVPMKNWLKRVEEDQEVACDQMVLRYQEGIASALVKMAKFSKYQERSLSAAFCALTKQSPFLLIRVEMALGISRIQETKFWRGVVPLIAGPLILLSCNA